MTEPTKFPPSNEDRSMNNQNPGKNEAFDPGFAMIAYANMMSQHAEYPNEMAKLFMTDQLNTKEKERIAGRLSGFNPKDNMVWREITQRFGASIKQPELLSIANVLAQSANIKLDRDAKRRKSVLIKWFEENWPSIRPFLDFVVLEDSHQTH